MLNNCDLTRSRFRVMKPTRDDSSCRLRPSLGLCLPHLLSPDLGLSPMLPSVLLTAWHSLLFITSASTCLCLWWAHSESCSPKDACELRVLITAFLTNIFLPIFFGIFDTGLAWDTYHSYIITRITWGLMLNQVYDAALRILQPGPGQLTQFLQNSIT